MRPPSLNATTLTQCDHPHSKSLRGDHSQFPHYSIIVSLHSKVYIVLEHWLFFWREFGAFNRNRLAFSAGSACHSGDACHVCCPPPPPLAHTRQNAIRCRVCVCVSVSVCVCVCVCVCMRICIRIYIHTHNYYVKSMFILTLCTNICTYIYIHTLATKFMLNAMSSMFILSAMLKIIC